MDGIVTPMLVLKNVTKTYGDRAALQGVTLRIDPGELVCLLGPSGSGKTTLLMLLIAALEPTSGAVEIDGVDARTIPKPALQLYRRRVGVMFQDRKLLPTRTVFENIAYPLEIAAAPRAAIIKRVDGMMERLGIRELSGAFPHELSAGQKTLVAAARAMVHEPLIVLADEPTQNLEADDAATVIELLRGLRKKGSTVLVATHDIGLTELLQTRVIGLEKGKVAGQGVMRKAARPTRAERAFGIMDDTSALEADRQEEEKKHVHITSIHSE